MARRPKHRAPATAPAQGPGPWSYLPSLHLLVFANREGMQLWLKLFYTDAAGRRTSRTLREATWHPSEVTEVKLAEWGRRALADWLADSAEMERYAQK